MKNVILRLGEQAPEDCVWAWVEDDGSSAVSRGSLAELASGTEGYRLLVLIPGTEVLLTRVALPPGNRKQLLAAIPYMLEESLAAEVEEQHFATGQSDGEGSLAVAVIARERMEHWLTLCRNHGLTPACMTPDLLALPTDRIGRAILLGADGLALVRSGPQDGFVLENDSLSLIPEMQGISADQPFVCYREENGPDLPEALAPFIAERRLVAESMTLLAEGLVEKEVINLLQGDYSAHAQWERHWRRWRLPAMLLLSLLLVQTGIGIRENLRLRRYQEKLGTEIVEVYRQSFPGAQKIVNPRAQMEHHLRTLRGGSSGGGPNNFLALLSRGGPQLVGGGNQQLHGLRYRSGELDLDLEISDLQSLEALKDRLSKQGLLVEIRTATTRGERVQARMQLKEGS